MIKIYVARVGEGTSALHEKTKGEYIGARGPYGKGFSFEGENVVAVIGGFGFPAILFYLEKAKGKNITVLQGTRTRSELLDKEDFGKAKRVEFSTDDGSFGHKGFVTDLLEPLFKEDKPDIAIACGPEPMLDKVCEITKEFDIQAQVLVERIMKCGRGAAGCCCLDKYRVCKDGPVFYRDQIHGKTEFGRWTRDKSGRRMPIKGASTKFFRSPPIEPFFPEYDSYLVTEIAGLKLLNPLMNASGTCFSGQYSVEIARNGAGAIVTKSTGLISKEGFHGPNFIDEYINAMGLPNSGIEDYGIEVKDMKKANVSMIQSLFGETPEECEKVARIAVSYGPNGIEENISCPHTSLGSVENNPDLVKKITKAVVSVAHPKKIPVFVKISANVDYIETAKTVCEAGADGITAINTIRIRPTDPTLNIPVLGSATGHGGLSGPKIKEKSEEVLRNLVKEIDKPIISVGGIESFDDVLKRLTMGASACQIGTAIMYKGLGIFRELNQELKNYLVAKGYDNVNEIIGIEAV